MGSLYHLGSVIQAIENGKFDAARQITILGTELVKASARRVCDPLLAGLIHCHPKSY